MATDLLTESAEPLTEAIVTAKAEELFMQSWLSPPHFTKQLECEYCGPVPVKPGSHSCPWCNTPYGEHKRHEFPTDDEVRRYYNLSEDDDCFGLSICLSSNRDDWAREMRTIAEVFRE